MIADDSIPMASGDVDEGHKEIGEKVKDEEMECVGSGKVAFCATEGGTLTHDPNDDPFVAKMDVDVADKTSVKLEGTI